MSTEALGQYMTVTSVHVGGRHPTIWEIQNKRTGILLCRVEWYAPWKRYISTYTNNNAVFDAQCHRDIATFLIK